MPLVEGTAKQRILDSISAAIATRRPQLQPYQLAEYHAARNWLRRYRPGEIQDNLTRVKGYLEAFYHLCEVADWASAHQVAFAQVEGDDSQELHELLFIWGYYCEQRQLHDGLLHRVDPDVDLVCLSSLGSLHDVRGDYHQAIKYHQQALNLAVEVGSPQAKGTALGNLGNAYLSLGEPQQAIDYYQQHLVIAQAMGNRQSMGIALGNLGNAYRIVEAYNQAIDCIQQRIEIAETIGDRRGEGDGYSNLGSVYLLQGRREEAIAVLQKAIAIAQAIGHRLGACRAHGNLGLVFAAVPDEIRAIECFEQALTLATAI